VVFVVWSNADKAVYQLITLHLFSGGHGSDCLFRRLVPEYFPPLPDDGGTEGEVKSDVQPDAEGEATVTVTVTKAEPKVKTTSSTELDAQSNN
jgi:hypothetical protein